MIPDTMRAFISAHPAPIESNALTLVKIPTPKPGPRELLIAVRTCGVCRTDLHVVEGDLPRADSGIIPGHQVVGEVIGHGQGCRSASEGGFRLGERVGVAWLHSTCQSCEWCLAGKENLCPHSLYSGYHVHGGYAEYMTVPEDYVYRIPEIYSDTSAAPLLCAGIIGYRALVRSNLPSAGTLGIYGFGSSAHITMQLALARRARVFVATRGAAHQELARTMGAAWCGDAFSSPPEPIDSAIIFAPNGDLIPGALRALKKGGTVALAGIHMSDCPALNYEQCLFHEKQLLSVEANTRADGTALLREAASIPIVPHVTEFVWTDAPLVLARLKADQIKGSAVLRVSVKE